MEDMTTMIRIFISIFIFLGLGGGATAITIPSFPAAEVSNSKESANSSADAANSVMGTSEKLNKNATQPLTAGTSLTTLDGTISGSGQLTNKASTSFLEVFIQPGGSGDLQNVYISQDLDFDGVYDTTLNISHPISGVCSDGYVTCNAGTWAGCEYRKWSVDTTGAIQNPIVSISEVSGCYCINNSCGTGLAWSNLSSVLGHLGGGAAGAVTQANPNWQITQTDILAGDMKVVFFGQDLSSNRILADGSVAGIASVPETGYYSRPGSTPALNIASATTAETVNQQSDPKSHYSTMSGLVSDIGNSTTSQTCSLKRTLTFTSPTILCSDPDPPGAILRTRINHEYYKVFDHDRSTKDDCRIGDKPQKYPEHYWVPADGPVYVASVAPADSTDTGQHFYVYTSCHKRRLRDDKGHYDVYKYYLYCSKDLDIASEEIIDGCTGPASDPECTLLDETVDGVEVLRNGGGTGLIPMPSPQTFTGQLQYYVVTRDWWVKDRVYRCNQTSGPYDFTDVQKRVKKVNNSVASTPSQATAIPYEDTTQGFDQETGALSGVWTNSTGMISLNAPDPTEDCTPMCKVKKPILATGITTVGPVSVQRTDNPGGSPLGANEQWEFVYKECSAGACPTEAGEIVTKDCGCLNDFAEATVVAETLNQAGKDVICSDGAKK